MAVVSFFIREELTVPEAEGGSSGAGGKAGGKSGASASASQQAAGGAPGVHLGREGVRERN